MMIHVFFRAASTNVDHTVSWSLNNTYLDVSVSVYSVSASLFPDNLASVPNPE